MLSEFYNYFNSPDGQEIIRNGWLRAEITDAIKMGSAKLITSITTIVLEGTSKVDIASPQLISPLENKGSDSDSDWVAINVEQSVKICRRSKYMSSI